MHSSSQVRCMVKRSFYAPATCLENLTVIQAYFPHYRVRKIYTLSPISEGLRGKLPTRRALNLWNVFSSINPTLKYVNKDLFQALFPGMAEMNWVSQVRPKAKGAGSSPQKFPLIWGICCSSDPSHFIFLPPIPKHPSPSHHRVLKDITCNQSFKVKRDIG